MIGDSDPKVLQLARKLVDKNIVIRVKRLFIDLPLDLSIESINIVISVGNQCLIPVE
jgi:hypothetical protein